MLCNKDVKQLTAYAHQLHELNHILQNFMPSMLIQYCKIKQYEYGNLKLEASSGSAATQLRFLQPQLMQKLKSHPKFSALQNISVVVSKPTQTLDRHYSRAVDAPSKQNCNLIRQTASSIEDDGLSAAMANLAKTLENYGKK